MTQATWSFGLELGMLYPSQTVLADLRQSAWLLGLEFEGFADRRLLGSTVSIRVSGDADAVRRYADAVTAHWR